MWPREYTLSAVSLRIFATIVVDKKSGSSVISVPEAPDKAPDLTDSLQRVSTTTPLEILDTSYVWLSLQNRYVWFFFGGQVLVTDVMNTYFSVVTYTLKPWKSFAELLMLC